MIYYVKTEKKIQTDDIDNPNIFAMSLHQAKQLFEQGDYTQAIPLLEELARQGNEQTLFMLGKYYYDQDQQNPSKENFYTAKSLLEQVAKQNNPEAQFLLGKIYASFGDVYPKESLCWFKKAVENGCKEAQKALEKYNFNSSNPIDDTEYRRNEEIKLLIHQGDCHNVEPIKFYIGEQVDIQEAVSFYLKASELGSAEAQYKLAMLYIYTCQWEQADYWLTKSLEQDFKKAFETMITFKDELTPPYKTKEYLTNTSYWIKKLSELVDAGKALRYGRIVRTQGGDINEAIFWYKVAAQQDSTEAQWDLGALYYQLKDYEKAVYWYEIAATKGDVYTQNELGMIFRYNETLKDINKSIYWYEKAAIQGSDDACCCLVNIYLEELKDCEKAIYWCKKAINQNQESIYDNCLAEVYSDRTKDYENAIYWYELLLKKTELRYLDESFIREKLTEYHSMLYKLKRKAEEGDAFLENNLFKNIIKKGKL